MATLQPIYLLSDATGETAEKMVMAALTQFRDKPVRFKRISNVRTKTQVYEALDEALSQGALVVYTIVNRELGQLVHDECDGLGLASLDLLTPLLLKVAQHVGRSPGETPGLLHGVDGMVREDGLLVRQVRFQVEHAKAHKVVRAGVNRRSARMVELIQRQRRAVPIVARGGVPFEAPPDVHGGAGQPQRYEHLLPHEVRIRLAGDASDAVVQDAEAEV